jgi:thiol-disulfide isomerase/thioredoxin
MSSWCKPCIKELPEFIKLANDTNHKKIKVLFVSLDVKKKMDESIKPIATKFKINPIYLLDESNPNNWIDKLDKNWNGEIPSTFIIKKGKIRHKTIGGISYHQLTKILK